MIELRKASQSKVAPLSPVDVAPQRRQKRRLFVRWPKTGAQKRLVYKERRRRDDLLLRANRCPYIFISVVGLVFVVAGSALTWYGTVSDVRDLLLIGPGSIVIGSVFVSVGLAFVFRILCRQCYAEREATIQSGWASSPEPPPAPPPPAVTLYGRQLPAVERFVPAPTASCGPSEVIGAAERNPPPLEGATEQSSHVTSDGDVRRSGHNGVSLCSEPSAKRPAIVRSATDGKQSNGSSSDTKQHSRPDSGYEAV